jgi:hypothetical protein
MLITELKKYTKKYAKTENGKWLNDFDWDSVPTITISDLPGDVCGLYGFGTIIILDSTIDFAFGTYIHELRHRWQRKKKPLVYFAGKIFRSLIEKDAAVETDKADDFIDSCK